MKILLALLLCVGVAHAETIATLPNKAGGKIVITDEPCNMYGKNYPNINRAYNYGTSGYSTEGCWTIEGETVAIMWENDTKAMRYPAENFTMNPNYSKRKGTNRGYNY